jgi:hypothetical protein
VVSLYVPQLIVKKNISPSEILTAMLLLYDNLKHKFWQLLTAFLAGNCKVWGSETTFSDSQNKNRFEGKTIIELLQTACLLSLENALKILFGE